MAQYIDKDTLVAEIEKRKEAFETSDGRRFHSLSDQILWNAFNSIQDILDTLEVKEVDLEKHLKEDIEDVFFDLNGVAVKGATHYLTVEDVKDIAKHFFELALSVNNPINAADRGVAEEIIINLKRVESDYRIDLTKEMEWVRNKVKK